MKTKSKYVAVGDVCTLKITAVTPTKHVGIDDTTYPFVVFVPNACVGSVIQARIVQNSIGYSIAQSVHVLSEKDALQNIEGTLINRQFVKKPVLQAFCDMVINGVHFGGINLFHTRHTLSKALGLLTCYALKGRKFIFISQKKSADGLVKKALYYTLNRQNRPHGVTVIIGRKDNIGIKTVATDCDPIPANNDSFASVKYVLQRIITVIKLADAIRALK